MERKLPEYYDLFRGAKLNDTIFCTIDSSITKFFIPTKFNNNYLKIVDEKAICSIVQSRYDSIKPPNYLKIGRFEKIDSTFYVQVSSLSCLKFGGGGIVGIYISKVNNKLIIKEALSSSIN